MSEESARSSLNRTFLGHPKGLYILFFTEMWERFSFYGMRFILILFLKDSLKGGLGWSDSAAYTTCGFYSMFVYLAGIPGGIIADRYLGKKRSVLIGGIFQCIGHFLLVYESLTTFFLGLVALVIGTGLIKSNISALVGSLYVKGDPKKDKGFSIFYMGINMGAMLAGFIVTTVAQTIGWHYGFGLAGIGMLIGIGIYIAFQHYIPEPKEEKIPADGFRKVSIAGFVTALYFVAIFLNIHCSGYTLILAEFIQKHKLLIANLIATNISFVILGYIAYITMKTNDKVERDRILAFVVSLLLAFIFFVCFEQAGGLMTLYTDKYTNTTLGGWTVPSSAVQNLNSIFVVLFSVLVRSLLLRLQKRSRYFNSTFQMAVGNVIMGLGFLFMIGACLERQYAADPLVAKSNLFWLVGAYFLHTIGELCLSPVILSFATNMAPKGVESLIMGIVFAVFGLANHFAAQLGALSESYGEKTIFQVTVAVPVVLGILFMLFNKKVVALTHGAEEEGKAK